MKMKLALRLGRTIAELDETMTAKEFYLWVGFDRINPIGDERGDIQSAQISSSIYQSVGGKVSIDDAMLKWTHEEVKNKDKFQELENFLVRVKNGKQAR